VGVRARFFRNPTAGPEDVTCHCSGTIFSPAFFARGTSQTLRGRKGGSGDGANCANLPKLIPIFQIYQLGDHFLVATTQQPLRSHCSPCWTSDWASHETWGVSINGDTPIAG